MFRFLVWLALAVPTFSFSQKQGTITVKKSNQEIVIDEISSDSIMQIEDDEVYTIVETMPEFVGGQEKMYRCLINNLKAPHSHLNISRIYICFVVEKNGKLTNIEVLRAANIDPATKESWIKTIDNMPKWKPGVQYGKPVRVKYTLPVLFKIN